MILSNPIAELLAGLASAMPEIGVYCRDHGGEAQHFGAALGVADQGNVVLPAGVEALSVRLADGMQVTAAFPAVERERLAALLEPLFETLARCEQLEQDMDSMSHSSLQLLEQVSMLGETLPRLSAAESDEDIAVLGLKACIVAASVQRGVYVRLHPAAGSCEVLAYAELDDAGQVQVRPYGLDVVQSAGEGLCREVFAATESVVLRTVQGGQLLGADGAPERLARREALGVPVTYDTGDRRVCLGAMLLFDKASTYDLYDARLGSEEGQVAMSFASMLGAVLGARLSAALGKELSMAQAIQGQILPAWPAKVRGFELAGDYRTSGDVGGDYFDYVPMADGRTLVTVADVSGHNLASGMMMVSARATLRTLAAVRTDPGLIFTDLGASMFTDLTSTERFITAAAVALRADQHVVEVVNAGHNDLMLFRAADGSIDRLPAESTVLGFLPRTQYEVRSVEMRPGDVLFLYTDGVTETVDEAGEMFGEERLEQVLTAVCRGSAKAVVAAVLDAVRSFQATGERGDDITLVAIKATALEARS